MKIEKLGKNHRKEVIGGLIVISVIGVLANFYNIGIDYLFNFYTEKSDIEYKPMNFNKLSENLKNFKEKNHLKLESLAIDAGTTVSTIWAYLNDKNKILKSSGNNSS